MKMYVVTYETSSLENLSLLQHVVSSCLLTQFVFCFLLKLKWPKNKIFYGMEVSLFGIPANRAHPKRDFANSSN